MKEHGNSDLLDKDYVDALSPLQFAKTFSVYQKFITEDPLNEFVRNPVFIDFNPVAGQLVLLKLIFGQKLDDTTKHKVLEKIGKKPDGSPNLVWTEFTEVELFYLLADCEYDFELIRHKNRITLCLGRRGGKTTIAAILGIWSAVRKDWKPLLGAKNKAEVKLLSQTVDFSKDILDEIKAIFERAPMLNRLIDLDGENSKTKISLKIPFIYEYKGREKIRYGRVTMTVTAATYASGRGGATIFSLLDECAFLPQDSTSPNSLKKVLAAIRPSLLQFKRDGINVLSSTPQTKVGPFYEKVKNRHNLPENELVLKGPSWLFNSLLGIEEWISEYIAEPYDFPTEIEASFIDSKSSFFRTDAIEACIPEGAQQEYVLPIKGEDWHYKGAIDAAFKGDKFVFSIVGVTKTKKDEIKVKQFYVANWYRDKDGDSESILKRAGEQINKMCRLYNLDTVYADQFAFVPLKELFKARHNISLEEVVFSSKSKKQMYSSLRTIIDNGAMELLNHPQTIQELKELEVEISDTGNIKISHLPGKHDDHADALCVAAFKAVERGELMFNISKGGDAILGPKSYGIKVDKRTGKSFAAPSPEMIAANPKYREQFGEVQDNSGLYTDDDGNFQKPLFRDRMGMPILEDDLRDDFPDQYRMWRDGEIKTQNDFDKALRDLDMYGDSGFIF